MKDLGATLVAVTPQVATRSQELIEKHNLTFDLLSDPGNSYAAELGIRFEINAGLKGVYQGFGIDLVDYNGDDSWTLPMPSRLVVDAGGIVRAADVHPNYTTRPEPDKTIDDVKALG